LTWEITNLDKEKMSKEGVMARVCMGLVVVDRDSSVIRLVHFSMQEYLQKHFERSSEAQALFAEKDMNDTIAKTCLTILLFDEFGKGECKSDAEFELRIQEYPIFIYAAAHWPYHVGSERSNDNRQLALLLLRDKYKVSSATQAVMVDRQLRSRRYSQKFPNRFTGLHMASYYGLEKSVESLLAGNWKINEQDSYGRTPLSLAALYGHAAVVKLLLEKGVDVESKDPTWGQTPISLAAEKGHAAVVKLLLEKGADLDSKDRNSWTPLSWAARNGHDEMVKLLLEKGADPESKDRNGWTLLSWAARNGHDAMVKLLPEKGAGLESKDGCGWTLLLWAARNGHDAMVKLLLEKGVDLEPKDIVYGQTPLSWAARNGHEAVVKLLLEKGVDLEPKDFEYGRTPLSWAAENGHKAVVKLLLEKNANLKSKDFVYGWTPRSWAAHKGHKAVVRLMSEASMESVFSIVQPTAGWGGAEWGWVN
jgi:ankyrin repeat protein